MKENFMYSTGLPTRVLKLLNFSKPTLAVLASLFIFLFFTSCASQYVVVDQSGMTFHLEKTKLKNGMEIEILDGEAVRKVHLKYIKKIVIDPTTTHYKDNKLYYHAKIELNDGTEIKPIKTEGKPTKSFVSIHNVIIGQAKSGQVTIPFENINVISKTDLESE